jgi:hypothetical protein
MFKEYFLGLSKRERDAYAKRANTTAYYIHTHLINRYKIPRKKLLLDLAVASEGNLTEAQVLNFFYQLGTGQDDQVCAVIDQRKQFRRAMDKQVASKDCCDIVNN